MHVRIFFGSKFHRVAFIVYVVYRLIRHHREFSKITANSNSALTVSRTLRLTLMSATFLFFTLPLSIYAMATDSQTSGLMEEYDWTSIHAHVRSYW
jgi:hypothetical protein